MSDTQIVDSTATEIASTTIPTPPAQNRPELSDSQKQARLYGKFARIMGDVKRLAKTKENKQNNFHYAPVEDIKDLVRPLLAHYNVGYSVKMTGQDVREQATKNGSRFVTRLHLEYKFVDGDDGGVELMTWTIEASDYGDFATTKALSMGLKYLFMTMFAISSGDEVDPDSGNTIPEAPANLMSQLLTMAKALFPAQKYPADDVFIGAFFDKWVGQGADFTLDNAIIVLTRLVAVANLQPVKTNKQKAQEEAQKAAKALSDHTETQG